MAITLTANKTTLVIGDKLDLTVTGDGTYTNYEYKRDTTVIHSGTDATFGIDPVQSGDAGSYTVTGTTADGTEVSTPVVITINKKTMTGITVTISTDKESYVVGDTATFTANVAGSPAGATAKFAWVAHAAVPGNNTNKYSETIESEGEDEVQVTATISAPDYNDFVAPVASKTYTADSQPIPVPEGGYAYVHPLPWRDSAFIQVGWWVIDEIHRAGQLGVDWKLAPDPLRYKRELLTLAKMFEDYEKVEVQESRNGYVWGKEQVEAGYFY